MSDIVERLRAGEWGADVEGAAEIERVRAVTIEECEVTISDIFASTSPRDYMMNGAGGILIRIINALHALKEQK